MMVFTSIYGVVDGLFVSNFAGKTALATVNIIWPIFMALGTIGFMFGAGGSALVGKHLGEGDSERANRVFSLLIYVLIGLSLVFTAIGYAIIVPICKAMGAEGDLLEQCKVYGYIVMAGLPVFMLQNAFQAMCVTAERPKFGLYVAIGAGIINMVLDALFIAVFKWGLVGASTATVAGEIFGGLVPLVYFFSKKNKSPLKLGKTKFEFKPIYLTCTNGASELVTNLSMNLICILYNAQLLKYAGEDGVAAFSIIMYVNFIFVAMFIGYAVGTAPIVSFNYGSQNHKELRGVFIKSLLIIGVSGVLMTVLGLSLAGPLAKLFVSYDQALYDLTKRGFMIFCIAFFVTGYNIYSSSFFTALNNGVISAIIAFARTVVLQVIAVYTLPLALGVDGIWASWDIAEGLAFIMDVSFIVAYRKRYHYGKKYVINDHNITMQMGNVKVELTDELIKEYKEIIGKDVHVIMDRPIGTEHPKHPGVFYPINYGFVDGIIGGDGEEQDVYILDEIEPIKEYDGKIIAVVHRFDDNETKWVAAKEDNYSIEDIEKIIAFQESFHDSKVIK